MSKEIHINNRLKFCKECLCPFEAHKRSGDVFVCQIEECKCSRPEGKAYIIYASELISKNKKHQIDNIISSIVSDAVDECIDCHSEMLLRDSRRSIKKRIVCRLLGKKLNKIASLLMPMTMAYHSTTIPFKLY